MSLIQRENTTGKKNQLNSVSTYHYRVVDVQTPHVNQGSDRDTAQTNKTQTAVRDESLFGKNVQGIRISELDGVVSNNCHPEDPQTMALRARSQLQSATSSPSQAFPISPARRIEIEEKFNEVFMKSQLVQNSPTADVKGATHSLSAPGYEKVQFPNKGAAQSMRIVNSEAVSVSAAFLHPCGTSAQNSALDPRIRKEMQNSNESVFQSPNVRKEAPEPSHLSPTAPILPRELQFAPEVPSNSPAVIFRAEEEVEEEVEMVSDTREQSLGVLEEGGGNLTKLSISGLNERNEQEAGSPEEGKDASTETGHPPLHYSEDMEICGDSEGEESGEGEEAEEREELSVCHVSDQCNPAVFAPVRNTQSVDEHEPQSPQKQVITERNDNLKSPETGSVEAGVAISESPSGRDSELLSMHRGMEVEENGAALPVAAPFRAENLPEITPSEKVQQVFNKARRRKNGHIPPPLPIPTSLLKQQMLPQKYGLKTSRSGRPLVPVLAFWRNQHLQKDKDGATIGIEEGTPEATAGGTGMFKFRVKLGPTTRGKRLNFSEHSDVKKAAGKVEKSKKKSKEEKKEASRLAKAEASKKRKLHQSVGDKEGKQKAEVDKPSKKLKTGEPKRTLKRAGNVAKNVGKILVNMRKMGAVRDRGEEVKKKALVLPKGSQERDEAEPPRKEMTAEAKVAESGGRGGKGKEGNDKALRGGAVQLSTNHWSEEQVECFQKALMATDPLATNYWASIAKQVPGKSSAECFDKHHSSHKTPPEPRPRSRISQSQRKAAPLPAGTNTSRWLSRLPKAPRGGLRSQLNARKAVREMIKQQQAEAASSRVQEQDLFAAFEFGDFRGQGRLGEGGNGASVGLQSPVGGRGGRAGGVPEASPEILRPIKDRKLIHGYVDAVLQRKHKESVTGVQSEAGGGSKLGSGSGKAGGLGSSLAELKALAAEVNLMGKESGLVFDEDDDDLDSAVESDHDT